MMERGEREEERVGDAGVVAEVGAGAVESVGVFEGASGSGRTRS